MKLLLSLIFSVLTLSAFGGAIDYRALRPDQFTTNLPSSGYVGIKGYGITNIPGTNVNISAGGSIIFTTNGANITITVTGLGQATNVFLIAGTNINIITNGTGTWTISGLNYWHTNAAVAGSVSNSYPGQVFISSTDSPLTLNASVVGDRTILRLENAGVVIGGFDWNVSDLLGLNLNLDTLSGATRGGQIYFDTDQIVVNENVAATAFIGNGSPLTNLNGTNIDIVYNGGLKAVSNGVHRVTVSVDTNAIQSFPIYATNVSYVAGGSITFITNANGSISISTVGIGQATNVFLIPGQNITIVTNGIGTWTISGNIGTNVVNSQITNQIPNFIHGTTNYIAKFTPNTNQVGDSIVSETATNQWEWRSRKAGTAWTNNITNTIYGRDSGAGSWDRLEFVAASGLGSGFNEINARTTLSGANGNAPLKVFEAVTINHGTTTASGNTAGYVQPVNDNAQAFGTTSKRWLSFNAGPAGYTASDAPTVNTSDANFKAGTFCMNLSTVGIWMEKTSFGFLGGFSRDADGNAGMYIGTGVIGAGTSTTTLNWDTHITRGNEAGTWNFATNNTGSSPRTVVLEGGRGLGTDKPGPDTQILASRSTGTGKAGDLYFGVSGAAGSTASSINSITNKMVLLNGASGGILVVSNNIAYATNSISSTMAPDFYLATATIITNAAFTLLAPVHVNAALFEQTTIRITNSTAASVLISVAGSVYVTGTPYVTNVTYLSASHWGNYETNYIFTPIR